MNIAFVLLVLLLTTSAAKSVEVSGELPYEKAEEAMNVACKVLAKELACPKQAPVVLLAPMPRGLWGWYQAGNVVFLNEDLWGPQWDTYGRAVLAHETVHYMVEQDGIEISDCDNEALAWRVYNAVVRAESRLDLSNDNWTRAYPRCKQE